jgi:hypothetical protein
VPQDVQLVHRARSRIIQISRRRSILVDIMEFAEAFGADTGSILSDMKELDGVISLASQQYLELGYEEMLRTCEPVESMIQDLEKQAVKLKNRALIWVYAVEWLAVTGTALCCGFILWTIMVQRRLYREVQVTRPRKAEI